MTEWLESISNLVMNQSWLTVESLVIVAAIAAAFFLISMVIEYGLARGTMATIARVVWVVPLFLALFPETSTEPLPRSMTLEPVHVLIDDSESMKTGQAGGESWLEKAEALTLSVEEQCRRFGCVPKISRLSELGDEPIGLYTPLVDSVESWLFKVGSDPWVLISDGGDWRPTLPWPEKLKGAGKLAGSSHPHGLIVGQKLKDETNFWIDQINAPPFSFEDKPFIADVTIKRNHIGEQETVQIQVLSVTESVTTTNVTFKPDESAAQVTVTIPPLPRGQHLLTVKALPTADEVAVWDNAVETQVEVMPNTVGVLHLLGSPSWDGRYLRRYLKSEPKYDLISFFILRDPWDSQQVSEREMSLIPFPVERLFNEELPNFRVVLIQNFTLFQFLLPEYQANLVKFVQEGGGVMFLGGPRALLSSDLSSSPLREILPFEVDGPDTAKSLTPFRGFAPTRQTDKTGPWYDPDWKFRIELAKPDSHKRALANVYDAWEKLGDEIGQWGAAKGLHHMENVKLKKEHTTTLLNAKTEDGQTIPFAVASYPGKGRALWVFSDSLWRMASDGKMSRHVYNDFLHAGMIWLMRQDLKKPLLIKNLSLQGGNHFASSFQATIQGPAARYFRLDQNWEIMVCGVKGAAEQMELQRLSSESWTLKGAISAKLASGQRCTVEINGRHEAFGSVRTAMTAVFPKVLQDSEVGVAPQKLEQLARLTSARLEFDEDTRNANVTEWLGQVTGREGIALPDRYKTLRNFFWILDTPWIWLMLLLLPVEVIIRRYDQLLGRA